MVYDREGMESYFVLSQNPKDTLGFLRLCLKDDTVSPHLTTACLMAIWRYSRPLLQVLVTWFQTSNGGICTPMWTHVGLPGIWQSACDSQLPSSADKWGNLWHFYWKSISLGGFWQRTPTGLHSPTEQPRHSLGDTAHWASLILCYWITSTTDFRQMFKKGKNRHQALWHPT